MNGNQHNSSTNLVSAALSALAIAIPMVAVPLACHSQGAPAQGSATASVSDTAIPNAMSSVSRIAAVGKALHVTVGHSIFIDTKTRLRRVYVTDPTILNSVTLSPTQIVVTAMSPGVSSLTLLDEINQAQSYVISADLDMDGLRTAMAQAMHGDTVKIEGSGGRVTLSGTVDSDAIADSAVKLAGLYSKEVANALTVKPIHPKQVRLQVRILEVDRGKALQLGINLFQPGGNGWVGVSTSSQFPSAAALTQSATQDLVTVSNPLSFFIYNFQHNIGATIQDLQTKNVLQILAEPNITAISGQKANFLAGGEFPFPIVQPGGNGGAPVVTISFRPYGVKLEFTPIVNEDGTIRLKVLPEVSALDFTNAVTISGFTVPALSTRRAETEVELRSDQSFAISGLLDQRTTDIMSKNPGIANIPILGNFFKSKTSNHSTTELIVVVTPTVIDPLTETTVPVQPEMPIQPLDRGGFDKSLGRNLNPNPATPPIDPAHEPYTNQAPPTPPAAAPAPAPVTAPPAGAAHDAAPATQTPQSAPVSISPNPAIGSAVVPPVKPAKTSMVEVVALSHESDVEPMVAALKRHGYDIAVNHEPHDSLLHLNVGPFANKRDAETMRQRLILDGYNATIK